MKKKTNSRLSFNTFGDQSSLIYPSDDLYDAFQPISQISNNGIIFNPSPRKQ
ncbi:hypothetical protein M378DRAFT_157318 [Amanita muscaria Koide BX008]|uniref:Uncharacterized protein n=1 Tax=Amanita muscaria (strain Koide BX008) TaxID=946122 RepID=A0A0C2XI08_AMAMK|nr:hypothetical protein M378DRAFT_157318 [Amanita muscaria Koide BX008]